MTEKPGTTESMAMDGPVIWVVVKQWPGGKVEPVGAYRDEQRARYAASRLIGREENWIVLWTTELHDE